MDKQRLIDANALLAKTKLYCKNCNNYNGIKCKSCDIADSIRDIEDAPTVDAELVRHGKWIWENKMMGGDFYRCSECGEVEFVEKILTPPTHCHCGAKMDK